MNFERNYELSLEHGSGLGNGSKILEKVPTRGKSHLKFIRGLVRSGREPEINHLDRVGKM